MQFVIFYALHPHRLKRTQADVQRDLGNFDPPRSDAIQDLGSEMQAGGRRGHGTTLSRVNRLVAVPVGSPILTPDVGRQRDMPEPIKSGEKVFGRFKADAPFAESSASDYFRLQSVGIAEEQPFPDSNLASRADQAFPFGGLDRKLFGKKNFNLSAQEVAGSRILRTQRLRTSAGSSPKQTRGENSRVVQYQQVIWAQKGWQIIEVGVDNRTGSTVQMQHPGARPIGKRLLSNQFFRQVKIKIRDLHARRL